MTQVGQTEVPKVRKGRSRDTCDIHAGSQAHSDTCSADFDRHADADYHCDGDGEDSGHFDTWGHWDPRGPNAQCQFFFTFANIPRSL